MMLGLELYYDDQWLRAPDAGNQIVVLFFDDLSWKKPRASST